MGNKFQQVNVFSSHPLKGNPLAIVYCERDEYSTEQMQQFARWTQLSETVFIMSASDERADYQIRIFTPSAELAFAGHPTLGACHSWLADRQQEVIYQQSAIGIVEIRQIGKRLYFQAPDCSEDRPFTEAELKQLYAATGLDANDVLATLVRCNGPVWHCVLLSSATTLSEISPNYSQMAGLNIGLCAKISGKAQLSVRSFIGNDETEDPVTGSLNAVLAQWLTANGELPTEYLAQQGSAVGACGEIWVTPIEGKLFIGGESTTVISGEMTL